MRGTFVVFFAASIAQGLFVVLFVFFVTDILGGADAEVGLLRGVQAIGAIGAGILLGVLAARFDVRRLAVTGVVAFALLSLVTWNLPFVTHDLWVYVVLFAVVGAPGVFMGDGLISILQLMSDDHERGHVFTTLGLVAALGQAVGMLSAGALQQAWGTLPLLEVQGGFYVVAALLAVTLLPKVRVRSEAAAG